MFNELMAAAAEAYQQRKISPNENSGRVTRNRAKTKKQVRAPAAADANPTPHATADDFTSGSTTTDAGAASTSTPAPVAGDDFTSGSTAPDAGAASTSTPAPIKDANAKKRKTNTDTLVSICPASNCPHICRPHPTCTLPHVGLLQRQCATQHQKF